MVDSSAKLQMALLESKFPFSKRMLHFFQNIELYTIAELASIPLQRFTCFKGFKVKCKEELVAFIEFEEIEDLFEGYQKWKKDMV